MLREYLKSLADKFRTYLGGEQNDLINAQDFTLAIDNVYEAGKQAAGGDCTHCDMLTDYGTRTAYQYGFYYNRLLDSNGNVLFKPEYDIQPTLANSMFEQTKGAIDLQAQFDKAGKVLDFSKCTNISRLFFRSEVSRIGIIDCTSTSALASTFGDCGNLAKVDGIIFSKDKNYTFTTPFLRCESLTDMTAMGSLASSGLDLSDCPLTHDSIMSFINILEPTSTTKTITFGSTNLAKLSDTEKAVATEKGWTLT